MHPAARFAIVAAVGLAAFGAGAGAAWLNAGRPTAEGEGPGPWSTRAGTGEASGGMTQRAAVARTGLWALPQSEVVYFRADTDDEGRPLSIACTYELAADHDPPTRWWSINLYRDLFWVDNPRDRYSYSKTTVSRTDSGGYRILVSAKEQPGDWLPMGEQDGHFILSFRNYQPEPIIANDPAATPLPSIRRLSCA